MQEFLTYVIVGFAIIIVLLKLVKQFLPRKSQNTKHDDMQMAQQQHNCSDCSAECVLRDVPKHVTEKNTVVCQKVEEKSKLS